MPKLLHPLTSRELQVFQLLTEGKSNAEIASALDISINTVKAHVSKIILKLNAKSRLHVVTSYRLSPKPR